MILIEKLQRKSALPPDKINKYENLTGEEILSSNQKQKQKKLQTKAIEDQGRNQLNLFKSIENKQLNLIKILAKMLTKMLTKQQII